MDNMPHNLESWVVNMAICGFQLSLLSIMMPRKRLLHFGLCTTFVLSIAFLVDIVILSDMPFLHSNSLFPNFYSLCKSTVTTMME